MEQKIVLGGAVFDKGKILILERHKNEDVFPELWELPSGKKEPLEVSEAALVREVKEETGLEVEVVTPISIFDYRIEKPDGVRDSTQINFLVVPRSGINVSLSPDHQAFAWVTLDDLDKYNPTANLTTAVRKALEEAKLRGFS